MRIQLAQLLQLWAKTNQAQGSAHPLLCHMIETTAVASVIFDHVLAPPTRAVIGEGWQLDPQQSRAWALFLAGIHDLGKASPVFQTQWDGAIKALRDAGFSTPPARLRIPHGTISALKLQHLLESTMDVQRKMASALAALVGGHHGVFPTAADYVNDSPMTTGTGLWHEARASLFDVLRNLTGVAVPPLRRSLPAFALVGGLITVSDWIASSERHFPYGLPATFTESDIPDWFDRSRRLAHDALRSLGWLSNISFPEPLDLTRLFGIPAPRPLQVRSIELADSLPHPALLIVEAPMGEGKTEAALYLAERLRQRYGLRGAFVGLPTQATSNQMFTRVAAALSSEGAEGIAHLHLLHGHAALSAEFELIRLNEWLFSPSSIAGDSPSAAVAAAEWFTHRKRGLLAAFGVGTVDQALMAALISKHVFVRLLGLSGKVVIIDEVHAYDTYMSELLGRLLSWLRSIGATVVLLSATLPASRRSALVREFSPAAELPPGPAAYPVITEVTASGARTVSFPPASPSREVHLLSVPVQPEDIAAWLEARLTCGGCAAVVCNTVGRAQSIYQACVARLPGPASDGGPEVDLLHSRFPFHIREERENRAIARFGKPDSAIRPHRAILVATQVIEQSLDIDFDVMLSELAPIDLLFQRTGRLHRHNRPNRPTGSAPELALIETPVDDAGLPEIPRAHKFVYDEWVLLRTWLSLLGRKSFTMPADIPVLLESVYGETGPQVPSPALQELLAKARRALEESHSEQRRQAALRYLPDPGGDFDLSSLTAFARDEDEGVHSFFRTLTRLTGTTVTVICLHGSAEDGWLDKNRTLPIDLASPPSLAHIRELLLRSCSVSNPRVAHRILAGEVPRAWQSSALLRHCRPVFFDRNGCANFGEHALVYSPTLGLTVESAS